MERNIQPHTGMRGGYREDDKTKGGSREESQKPSLQDEEGTRVPIIDNFKVKGFFV